MKCEIHPLVELDADDVCSACVAAYNNRQKQIWRRLRRPHTMDISTGELADRYTIWLLKSRRITNPAKRKLAEVNALRYRQAIYGSSEVIAIPGFDEPLLALEHVNEQLWDIEDAIRALDFDVFDDSDSIDPTLLADAEYAEMLNKYCQLARSVYTLNDQRAEIKRQLDDLTGHETDHKQYKES